MSTIGNVTDVYFSNDNTDNNIELQIYKNSLTHALFIPNILYDKINVLKSQNNIYDIFTLSFQKSGIGIINYGNSNFNIEKILIQKSLKYKKKYNTAFNIIGYYLYNLASKQFSWMTLNNFNEDNYSYIDKSVDNILKGSISVRSNMKKIRLNVRYESQSENNNITVKNLINTSNTNKLLGFKNEIENTFQIVPLLKPYSEIIFDTRIVENSVLNVNDLIEFDNITSFIIPQLNYSDELRIYNINMRPLRFTNIIENVKESETIIFSFSSVGVNKEMYNLDFDLLNSPYVINLNVITIKFRNNFSSEQIDNRILINKYTNQNIETERLGDDGEVKKEDINISGWTKNYFLSQKLHGITLNRFETVFNYKNIRYDLVIRNSNKEMIDLYFENKSSISENGIYNILDKIENVDYNNDVLNLYPKAKENQEGNKAAIKFLLNNCNIDILNNVFIDDSIVSIAGITVSNNKLLVNLNMVLNEGAPRRRDNLRATYSNKIYFQPIAEDFFYKLRVNQQLITDRNFIVDFLKADGRGSYLSGDLQGKEFFKNPLLSTNILVETFRYKTFISDNNNNIDIRFERLNLSDKTLQDLSKNNVTLLSKNNPNFKTNEGNILYFDTSDYSNKGLTIRFYHDISCENEIFNENGYTLAEYSRTMKTVKMVDIYPLKYLQRVTTV